jgi:mannose-6-phosphate isomerase-like protein (cupin superfamily)
MAAEATSRSEPASETRRRAYWFYGDLVIVHISGEETGRRFCLLEFIQPPGEWTPLHVRRDAHLTQYVLEGELTVYQPRRSFVLGPGESVNTPLNVPRTECVTSPGPVRVLDMQAPAGFDEFVAAAGEPATELTLPPSDRRPPDLERLGQVADEHGIGLLGPPGSLP